MDERRAKLHYVAFSVIVKFNNPKIKKDSWQNIEQVYDLYKVKDGRVSMDILCLKYLCITLFTNNA